MLHIAKVPTVVASFSCDKIYSLYLGFSILIKIMHFPYYPTETKHRYTNKSKKLSDFNIIRMYMPFKFQQEFADDTVESR